jgi:DNA repair protein RecO (recombination protein O)
MEWHDDGIIIGAKKHGETSLILEVMTRTHGRHLGLVKGGRSKRMQPLLQPGNSVEVTWRARLEEHLGFYAVEATLLRAGDLMAGPATLHGLNLMTALLRLLAEREQHEALFDLALGLIEHLGDPAIAPQALVQFELAILADCGFGVDLEACAATGAREDLVFVSPKSARAVSRTAGEPYRDRLLRLPGFLVGGRMNRVPPADVRDGFALAGHFLLRDLFAPRGLALPDAHDAYVALLLKHETADMA